MWENFSGEESMPFSELEMNENNFEQVSESERWTNILINNLIDLKDHNFDDS